MMKTTLLFCALYLACFGSTVLATEECAIRMELLSRQGSTCEQGGHQCRDLCSGELVTTKDACDATPFCCFVGGECLLKSTPGQQQPLNSDEVSLVFVEKLNKTVNDKLTVESFNGQAFFTVNNYGEASGRFLTLGGDNSPFGTEDYGGFEIFIEGGELLEGLGVIAPETQGDGDCSPTFPNNCVIEYSSPDNLNPKINIPYCQRIACDPTNAALNVDMEACLASPGCGFDDDLFLYRTFAGDSFMPGVPVCHLAIRNKVFQKHALPYIQENLEWNPLLTECMIEEYKDEILAESAGCHMLDVLEHFGKSPKLAGWEGISQRDCYLIGGCWRSSSCVYPLEPGKDIKVQSTNDVKHMVPTPADKFGQPACQAFDPASTNGNFLDSFHKCLEAGCATDVSRETLLKHFHGVTSTYLPKPMQYQFWSLVMLGRVRPDNWKQVADDLKKVETESPVNLLSNAQLHYVGSFKTPGASSSTLDPNKVSGRMLGLVNNEISGAFTEQGHPFATEGNPFGGQQAIFGNGVDPLQNLLNLLPGNELEKTDSVNAFGGSSEFPDFGGIGGLTELPDHLTQGAIAPEAGSLSTGGQLAQFGSVNKFDQNTLPSGTPFGNNALFGANGLAAGHNSKHPINNEHFLKVNLGNAGLINLGATGQIRPVGGVGSINQYLPNVLYNVLPKDLCPFNPVQWEGMPQLKGSFKGCCKQPLCYTPRESLVFARSGVASYLGAWTSWTQCTKTCGTGSQKRLRNCVGGDCDSSEEETRECNFQACPQWGQWGAFGSCTKTCGGGSQSRSRLCNTISGGCEGSTTEEAACNTGACPVISEWGEWSSCSVDCGRGTKTRQRTCVSEGEYGCPADQEQSQECRVYCGSITLEDTACDVSTCIQYPRCVRSDGRPGFCREELIRANSKPCYAGRCLCRVFPSAAGCF